MAVAVTAFLLCVGANSVDLLPPAVPAFDPKGYYIARPDYRKCMSPMCGGYWIHLANKRRTTCADGSRQKECYVSRVVSETDFTFKGPSMLLKGIHSSEETDAWGTLGVFTLETAHTQATDSEERGMFVGVADNGVRCIMAPCPSITEHKLNYGSTRVISSISFSKDLDADVVAWANEKIFSGEVVVATGRHRRHRRGLGRAGRGVELVVNQIYRPVGCPAGYMLYKEECRTPYGCVYPELEQTAAGGAPRTDPVTGEVTGTIIKSCVKQCDSPSFPSGPGQCYLALP